MPNRVLIRTLPRGARLGGFLNRTVRKHLRTLKLQGCEVSVSLVGDARIRSINRTWREKDEATDVLSFPAGDWPGPGPRPLGDLIVSLDTAERVSRALGFTLEHELERYLAHGLLHLLGHDHHRKADAKKMARAERKLIGAEGMLGVPT